MSLEFQYQINEIPDGEPMTADELEAMCLKKLEQRNGRCPESLQRLAMIYAGEDRIEDAVECLRCWHALTEDSETLALIELKLGALAEQVGDFRRAVDHYRTCLAHEPRGDDLRYFGRNNLGYSLIQIGQPEAAIPVLREAAEIDPQRVNAIKNVGVACEALGRHVEAARFFIKATMVNATDSRSTAHLEALLTAHPELTEEHPDIAQMAEECRQAVELAQSVQPDMEQAWRAKRRPEPPADANT